MPTPGELAGLPEGGPATPELVRAQLSLGTAEDPALDAAIAAVNSLVRRLPVAARTAGTADEPAASWDAPAVTGAVMLAARLYRRRNSPDGVTAMNELGPVYVQRNDPDVAMLLELGTYTRPAVG